MATSIPMPSALPLPASMANMATIKGSAAAVTGEAHFLEETMNPARVREYLMASKEYEKAKGMKWLLAMMSKGSDASEFFSDVVKNVAVKGVEVKKMVYMYLVHYADANATCRELALLSINSFQKDLAASNQLVRAMALRVMSSIRVPEIIQIQLLAVKKCASDSSPYVRKCAANAIPKIFRLDREQREALEDLVEKLLSDSSCMVLGGAVAAFNEVCPDKWTILHRSFRKLCHLLADVDEWAQITILQVLTRYLRTQFGDPAPGMTEAARIRAQQRSQAGALAAPRKIKRRVVKKAFYSDEEDESQEEEVEVGGFGSPAQPEIGSVFTGGDQDTDGNLDPDHRLLLRSSLPLLKSRNSGVVLAVCTLHYYCGSQSSSTAASVGKALVRILRNAREIQFVVLKAIATMARERPQIFVPFLADFFVKATDPLFCAVLKLQVLTCLTVSSNVQQILRELQSYVRHSDKAFVCETLRAVGRVADAQPEVADRCMAGMIALLQCTASDVVQETAVIVVRQLIQQSAVPDPNLGPTLKLLTQMLLHEYEAIPEQIPACIGEDKAPVPMLPGTKSSILWLLSEYWTCSDSLQRVAPDVLRLVAKSFTEEEVEVKAQILNLAVKLSLGLFGEERTTVQTLANYVLELARYDLNHDLRDRSRFATAIMGLVPTSMDPSQVEHTALEALRTKAQQVMRSKKLPPLTLLGPVAVEGHSNLTIGSLSSIVGHEAKGYQTLPAWPAVPPDPSVRDASLPDAVDNGDAVYAPAGGKDHAGHGFYSDEDDSDESDSEDSDSEDSDESDSGDSGSGDSETDSDDEDTGESGSELSSDPEPAAGAPEMSLLGGAYGSATAAAPSLPPMAAPEGNLLDPFEPADQLAAPPPPGIAAPVADLPLDDLMSGLSLHSPPTTTPEEAARPGVPAPLAQSTGALAQVPQFSQPRTLLRRELGGGLLVTYEFARGLPVGGPTATGVRFSLENKGEDILRRIRLSCAKDTKMSSFQDVAVLEPRQSVSGSVVLEPPLGAQEVKFEVRSDKGVAKVAMPLPVEERVQPLQLTPDAFEAAAKTLTGFHMSKSVVSVRNLPGLPDKVVETANMCPVDAGWLHGTGGRWAGRLPKAGGGVDRILLAASQGSGDGEVSLTMHADDPMVTATLMDKFKKGLLE
uniref:AP-3 complex subunit beta n=1 Tax=Rhizochromulina marina TaxID=1034831 RepID=A0A7S2SUN3_9STRA